MEKISSTLETHKTDYSIVTETQSENVKIREEVLRLTEEVQQLQNDLELTRQSHTSQIELITQEHNEKSAFNREKRFSSPKLL